MILDTIGNVLIFFIGYLFGKGYKRIIFDTMDFKKELDKRNKKEMVKKK